MSKTTKKAPAKPEHKDDEFENLDSEDLTLDDGVENDKEETNELEEELNSEESGEEGEELEETLEDIEKEETNKKPAKKTEPVKPTGKPTKKVEPKKEETVDDEELSLEDDAGDGTEGNGEDAGNEETTDDTEELPEEPAKEVKKTTAKKETKETKKPGKIEEYITKYGGEYQEDFEIKKIKTGKYEIRESKRSEDTIKKLADDINSRGQLEPIHVVHEGKEFHLIAGYHRYFAMKGLKLETIRAIVYSDLSLDQIQAIASGTNAIRTDLTEWDKICSVAKYHESNPDVSISSKNPHDKTLCTIFGYGKTRIYEYINIYDFLKNFKNEKLLEFVQSANLPVHYLLGIYNAREHIKETDVDPIIKLFKERPDLRMKEFDIEFTAYLNEIHVSSDGEDDDELVDGDVDIPTDKKTKTKKDQIEEAVGSEDEPDEQAELKKNVKKKVTECINKMTEIHTILTELTQYDELKSLTEDKISKILIKKSTEVSKLSSKLFN